uniref:HAT C-terminal dimerisation domain-containing protein n=1 Tax=Chenopodium quinoa TaxID=63459 RepID=A0A803ND99_CHEQI
MSMAHGMKKMHEKYWDNVDNINLMLYVAVVLDPRRKMHYVKWAINDQYDFVKAAKLHDMNFDALGWWKKGVERYPIVGLMDRDVLAISVSTVEFESAFSTGGRVFDVFRSSLSSHMVEALICAQDWMRTTRDLLMIEESIDDTQQIKEELSSLVEPPAVSVVDDYF